MGVGGLKVQPPTAFPKSDPARSHKLSLTCKGIIWCADGPQPTKFTTGIFGLISVPRNVSPFSHTECTPTIILGTSHPQEHFVDQAHKVGLPGPPLQPVSHGPLICWLGVFDAKIEQRTGAGGRVVLRIDTFQTVWPPQQKCAK